MIEEEARRDGIKTAGQTGHEGAYYETRAVESRRNAHGLKISLVGPVLANPQTTPVSPSPFPARQQTHMKSHVSPS
jgi:hypothetical protein